MPRRRRPDPLGKEIGWRITKIREERGLTLEKLAYESEVGSKGYLSDIEAGLALPSVTTLAAIAAHLDVFLLDLFTFPHRSDRERLTNRLRTVPAGVIKRLLRDLGPPRRPPQERPKA